MEKESKNGYQLSGEKLKDYRLSEVLVITANASDSMGRDLRKLQNSKVVICYWKT